MFQVKEKKMQRKHKPIPMALAMVGIGLHPSNWTHLGEE
jgi:hypothetical protein